MAYPELKNENYENLGGINSKASPYITEKTEFLDLVNVNFSTPGSLTKRHGTTLFCSATVTGRITGLYEFERLSGASYLIATANTNAYTVTSSAFTSFKSGLDDGALSDFVTFVDRLFVCNGGQFFKYDGTNTSNYGLPAPVSGWGVTLVAGGSLAAGVTTTFFVTYAYLNDRGYFGPAADGITITVAGSAAANTIRFYGLTTPAGYGVSALAFYRSTGGAAPVGTTQSVAGSATFDDIGYALTTREESSAVNFTLVPKYLEIFNNQLFMAGFTTAPSTVAWSQIGEPEAVDPNYSAEFRTNDGDRITGLKSYNGTIVATKERSFHKVSGEDPSNFLLSEISDQYGCLSNRAIVTFEDFLWFLDTKGIVEYNGASVKIISNKVESVFQSMNVSAARDNAIAVHFRDLNELWFAIPINGSSVNNCVVVYDYLIEAWTTYKGVDISALVLAKRAYTSRTPFFGGYTGQIGYYSASLYSDVGGGITCSISSRYITQTGQTTQRMFRRFYLNVDPVAGVTSPIEINLRQDYGSSIIATRTMYQAPFQSRIDFGVSARSIQAQIVHSSASLPFKMNGFSFESRFLRNT